MPSADSTTLLYLSRADVAATALDPCRVADRIEQALLARRDGRLWSVPKSAAVPGDGRQFQAMVAVADEPAVAAVKAIALAPDNANRGLPHVAALITLFDAVTATPIAVMDGAAVTAARTAAMTLVAGRRLARHDSEVMGLVGVGVQARSHLAAFAAEFPLKRVLVRGRSRGGVAAFLDYSRGLGLDAAEAASPEALLVEVDIVVSSVPASPDLEPMLDVEHLRAGAFAGMCDNGRSWHRSGLARFDHLYIDDAVQEHAAHLHGAGLVDEALVNGDLTTLVEGATPARLDARERTAFVFRGLALADLAAATLVLERATIDGLGQRLPL